MKKLADQFGNQISAAGSAIEKMSVVSNSTQSTSQAERMSDDEIDEGKLKYVLGNVG